MAGYIGTQAVSVNTTSATISDDLTVGDDLTVTDDATIGGTLGVTGVVAANGGVVVDNFTLDGTTLALSSGDMLIDVAGNIQLDADDNGETRFLDDGTGYLTLKKDGNNAVVQSQVSDGDLVLGGNDGGSLISALTLDMSEAGQAAFNNGITAVAVRVSDNMEIRANDAELYFTNAANDRYARFVRDNTHNDIDMSFYNGSSVSNRFKFRAAGDLQVITGNLVIGTAGKGIDFTAADSGATGASGNLMDDYEEGVCTLTWSGSGGTANSTNTAFKYVKVGNLVSINGSTAATIPNATGTLILTGLPFAANGHAAGSILYRNITAPSNAHTLVAYVNSTSTTINPYWSSAANYAQLVSGNFNASGAQDIYLSVNYRTS